MRCHSTLCPPPPINSLIFHPIRLVLLPRRWHSNAAGSDSPTMPFVVAYLCGILSSSGLIPRTLIPINNISHQSSLLSFLATSCFDLAHLALVAWTNLTSSRFISSSSLTFSSLSFPLSLSLLSFSFFFFLKGLLSLQTRLVFTSDLFYSVSPFPLLSLSHIWQNTI